MLATRKKMPFSLAVVLNPTVPLKKGIPYPFVSMDAVDPSSRYVQASEVRIFNGSGSRFCAGDILMARITPCLENGKIAQFDADKDEMGHGSTEFIIIRGREGLSDTTYCYYLTKSDLVRKYAVSQMSGTSGRQRVQLDAFNSLFIELPCLSEQKAIAHILGTLDDKIGLNRRMNETLEQMARAIFKSWFVDFDPVRAKMSGRWKKGESLPGLPAHLWDLFPDRLLPSELGDIPEGWKISDLHSIASFLNGLPLQNYPPKEGRGLPIIKISQLHNRNISGAEMASDDIDPEFIINNGDIIFSWSGSLECVLWTGGKGALNQHLFKVSSQSFPMWWVYFWIHQHLPAFRKIAAGKATTMGHIQRHHLEEAKIILPPDFIMEKADELISPLWLRLIQLSSQNSSLSGLRDILLPKLISGQIDLVKFCTSGET